MIRRWSGPTAKRRAAKARLRKLEERAAMQQVRERDVRCRFPLCARQEPLETSHQRHRGMGGNPALDRSTTALMVLVCHSHHQGPRYSLDAKTVRWVPMTSAGADGTIRWEVFGPLGWTVLAEEGVEMDEDQRILRACLP